MSHGPPEWDDPGFTVSFDDPPGQPARARPPARRILLGLLTALVLLGGASLATSQVLKEPEQVRTPAETGVEKPNAPLQRANEFATEFNTYSASDAAEYQQRVAPLLTAGFAKTFRSGVPATFRALRKEKKGSIATVASSAIERAGNRSATALVFINVATTSKNSWGPVGRTLRWNVHLTRFGDQWRVSGYDAIAAGASTGATPRSGSPDSPESAAASGAETIFSFRYDDLGRHLTRSRQLMTPSYAGRFDTVSCALTGTAPRDVVVAARTVAGAPTVLRQRLQVDLERDEGRWLVDDLALL